MTLCRLFPCSQSRTNDHSILLSMYYDHQSVALLCLYTTPLLGTADIVIVPFKCHHYLATQDPESAVLSSLAESKWRPFDHLTTVMSPSCPWNSRKRGLLPPDIFPRRSSCIWNTRTRGFLLLSAPPIQVPAASRAPSVGRRRPENTEPPKRESLVASRFNRQEKSTLVLQVTAKL